jgi:hypothetical protein
MSKRSSAVPSPKPQSLYGASRILADLRAEHNAQKLKIAC